MYLQSFLWFRFGLGWGWCGALTLAQRSHPKFSIRKSQSPEENRPGNLKLFYELGIIVETVMRLRPTVNGERMERETTEMGDIDRQMEEAADQRTSWTRAQGNTTEL